MSFRRPFALLLASTAPGLRLLSASPAALGGAALASCPQKSRPQISASRVRSMIMAGYVKWQNDASKGVFKSVARLHISPEIYPKAPKTP